VWSIFNIIRWVAAAARLSLSVRQQLVLVYYQESDNRELIRALFICRAWPRLRRNVTHAVLITVAGMGVDRATSLTHCYTVVGELQSDLQPCRPRGTTRFHSSHLLIIARTKLRAKTGHRRNCCGNLGQQSPKLFSWEVYHFQQLRIEKKPFVTRNILLCSLLLVYSKCRTLQSVRVIATSPFRVPKTVRAAEAT